MQLQYDMNSTEFASASDLSLRTSFAKLVWQSVLLAVQIVEQSILSGEFVGIYNHMVGFNDLIQGYYGLPHQ